jgi:hypothetical protein
MLELIVLGQIPGTHIQLSFNSVVFVWITAVIFYAYASHGPKFQAALEREFRIVLIYLTLKLKI